MKSIIPILVVSIFFICCSSATRISYHSNTKKTAIDYKTYSWQSFKTIRGTETHPVYYNELNDLRIREAVNKQMQLNHYQLKDSGGELQIRYRFVVTSKITVLDTLHDPSYYQTQVQPYYKNYSNSSKYDFEFPESPLIIEMFDAKTNGLIWQGSAANAISSTLNIPPALAIQNAVMDIFKGFPAGKE